MSRRRHPLDHRTTMRWRTADWHEVDTAAAVLGLETSEWIRRVMVDEARRVLAESRKPLETVENL